MKKTLKQLLSVVKTHLGGFFLTTYKQNIPHTIFNIVIKDNKKYLNIDLKDFEGISISNNGNAIVFKDALLVESTSHIAFKGKNFWMQPDIDGIISKEKLDMKFKELTLPTFEELHHEYPLSQHEKLIDIKNRNKHNHVAKKYTRLKNKCQCKCNH